jgi:hypothetical protein
VGGDRDSFGDPLGWILDCRFLFVFWVAQYNYAMKKKKSQEDQKCSAMKNSEDLQEDLECEEEVVEEEESRN